MGIVLKLSEIALKQLAGDGADGALRLVRDHVTDQGQRVRDALNNANKWAWQTLEIALAGTSWWDQMKNSFASSETRAFAHELQTFIGSTPLPMLAGYDDFRQRCLRELQHARKHRIIPGDHLTAEEVAQQPAGWVRHDAQTVLAAETAGLAAIAQQLTEHKCEGLAWLIQQRPHGGTPLLALAVRYFFRREIEADTQLFQGLTFQQIEGLTQDQAQRFSQLNAGLAKHGQRLEELLGGLQQDISVIKGGVLDLRAELGLIGKNLQDEARALHGAVLKLLEERHLHARPVRPRDSLSIRTDQERALVNNLLARYRKLPEGQRQAVPALANGLGQLELAVGNHESAQRTFATAASLTTDQLAQAEAHYNAYRAAVARGRNEEALRELREALVPDSSRFAPFPLDLYEPLGILGVGGFGVTFLCLNKLLNSKVAVKALVREDLERNVGEVFQEAAALDQLHHRAIIQLRTCGYADAAKARPFVVMEYFEGQTLEQYVKATGPLPWEDFKAVSLLVAEGLAAAHAKNILHRDVKPANILVRREAAGWEVRLIDFGLALNQTALDAVSTIRQGQGMTGTLDYAAPEQLGKLTGVRPGPSADIYGFGRTCCFALFQTPQPGPNDWQTLPPSAQNVLGSCVAESPTKRPASFAEVLDGLSKARRPRREFQRRGAGRPQQGPHQQERRKPPHPDTTPPISPPAPSALPAGARPRLLVLRGQKRNVEYPIYEGQNFIGRADEKPVDIDLTGQELGRIWTSREHACIFFENGQLALKDLNSANGTYVNRTRIDPGSKCPLAVNDILQIGAVQLKVLA